MAMGRRRRATDSGMARHTAVSVVVRSGPLPSAAMRTYGLDIDAAPKREYIIRISV